MPLYVYKGRLYQCNTEYSLYQANSVTVMKQLDLWFKIDKFRIWVVDV